LTNRPEAKDFQLNEKHVSFISTFDRKVEARMKLIGDCIQFALFILLGALVFFISYLLFKNRLPGNISLFIIGTGYIGWFMVMIALAAISDSSFYKKTLAKIKDWQKKHFILDAGMSLAEYETALQNYSLFEMKLAEYETSLKEAERSSIYTWVAELEGYLELLKHKRDNNFIKPIQSIYLRKLEDYILISNAFKHYWHEDFKKVNYFRSKRVWIEEKLKKNAELKEPNVRASSTPAIKKEVKTKPDVSIINIEDFFSDVPNDSVKDKSIEEISRKVNYAEQNIKNANVGLLGEEFIFRYEVERLMLLNRSDLAERVYHVSKIEGDGKGYDIVSFNAEGEKIYIEVKTTTGGVSTQFYLTANEWNVIDRTPTYIIYRVFDFNLETKKGVILKIRGKKEIEKYFDVKATNYKVVPRMK
jgi:hypothetical protein